MKKHTAKTTKPKINRKKSPRKASKPKLMEFYGTECPHCNNMHPLIARLERETGFKVEKYEVWHNDRNAALLDSIDRGYCGGVPFFFNVSTGEFICGEVDYETLKIWATNGMKK